MGERSLIGAVDQGTTGTRCIVFDDTSRVIASAYETHDQLYPQPGWVEHDPEEIWDTTQLVIDRALADGGIDPADLAAIGITNQRETTVMWDRETGEPVHNAIVWQDRRTADRIDDIRERNLDDMIRERTGLEPDAYFSATKLEWLLDHAVDQPPESLRAGTIDTWLIDRLTGEHITDVTNASRTMLFDIDREEWDAELLEEFGVPDEILPRVRPSIDAEPYGCTDPDGWLGAEVPIAAAMGDQQSALFGQTCFDRGEAKNTYGTGSFLLFNTGTERVRSEHGVLSTIAYSVAGEPTRYALEGSIFVTGAAIEWLVDVGIVSDPGETAALARSVDDTNGVVVVPAFTGLGAPHWDQQARGTILGLTRDATAAHLTRATLESIGFLTRDVLEAMSADAGTHIDELQVDGGAVANDVLCQLQADVLDIPVVRPAVRETTALGAAYAAGLVTGVWESREELRSHWDAERVFHPESTENEIDAKYARWHDAVDRAGGWATR